jgi:predicted dehydrogenase
VVRIGLVGCGMRGRQLVRALGQSGRLRLTAVCDVDARRLEEVAREHGVAAEADAGALAARHDVDAVVVAVDARWHVPVALEAVARGRPVYVEKPLADSPEAAWRLVEAQEAQGVIGIVGYQFRATRTAQVLAQAVRDVEPVQGLLTVQRGPMNPQYFFPDHYGGIADTATHTIHNALWLMGGRAEAVAASVQRGTILGDQTLEFLSLLIDFDGGRRTCAVVGSMLGLRIPNVTSFVGTRGTVHLQDGRIRVARHGGIHQAGAREPADLVVEEVVVQDGGDATVALLEHFADLVEGRVPWNARAAASLREGAEAVAVTRAMVEAAATGRKVPLDEVARL